MNNPKVSICIPNYNNDKYLALCIESAISQKFDDYEIIFLDDCSTDKSLEIANKYSKKISIYKNKTNLGQTRNTNKVISIAKGEYIVILHSDDQLLPTFCASLSSLLDKHPNVVMAVGERQETTENNTIKHISPFYNTNCIVPGILQAKVFMMTSFLPCQVLFRKEIFIKSGQVNENHIVNLDGLLWFQISLYGDLAYIQEEVGIYRIHNNNITSYYNKRIDHMIEYFMTLKEMFKLSKGNSYLESFYEIAEKNVGKLAVRYTHYVMKNKDYLLATRYLKLAEVFNLDIVKDADFINIKECLSSKDIESSYLKLNDKIQVRNFSYEPPSGYIKIKSDINEK